MISLHVHSLVAYVLPIIIHSKVVTTMEISSLNKDSQSSEHHMPGVPAQGSTTLHIAWTYIYMHVVCVCVCAVVIQVQVQVQVHMCVCMCVCACNV